MRIPSVILALSGGVFVAVGIWFLFDPVGAAATVQIPLEAPMAIADIRAVYGGLDLAVGIFLLRNAFTERVAEGLRLQAVAFAGLLVGRLLGQTVDAPTDSLAAVLIAVEGSGLALALVGIRMLKADE